MRDFSGGNEGDGETLGLPKVCPRCGNEQWIPIVYGLPSSDLFEEASRGEVALGGCLIVEGQPGWRCGHCRFEWPNLLQ